MAGRKRRGGPVDGLHEADVTLACETAGARHHPMIAAAGHVADLSDQPPMLAMTSATLVLGLIAGDRRLSRAGGRMLLSVCIAIGLKTMVKRAVDRTRPHVVLDEGDYRLAKGSEDASPVNSFPSGHTADAVAAGRAGTREYPAAGPAAAGAALFVGLMQLPMGRHYTSDVIAGAVVGALAEGIADRLVMALTPPVSRLVDRG